MHDYQLERLNTRSFEQLVQALALEIVGPHLTVFGDGPDGGREATFGGPVLYPPGGREWNGIGILQAKFRQQPYAVPKQNADWVIRQLKSEFAKLSRRSHRDRSRQSAQRRCPQYYILATNLSLSSVARTGGKDRVAAVLDGYKRSHGLIGYAVWDGDQIRRFLDARPTIRTTYAAWLLPGDVLGQMLKTLRLKDVGFLPTMKRYLESELLDDEFARLGQGGYTDAKNIPLCSVFVDLPIDPLAGPRSIRIPERLLSNFRGTQDSAGDDEEADATGTEPCTFLHIFFEEGRQVLRPSARPSHERTSPASAECFGRIVLIGGPGQGKTTAGQFACQLFRAELLRASGGPFSAEVSQALDRIHAISDGLPKVHARRYPLRVDLKHLAACLAAIGGEHASNLFDYLLKRIRNRTNTSLEPEDFRCWLKAYPWVLVLDGLDEVPASSNRRQVMQAIRDFVSVEAHSVDADLLILATTRPQGYSEEFDTSLYRHLSLGSLDPTQALEYGLRLAVARHPGQPSRVEELTSSLRKAAGNPATARLMKSPLQVTIMLALIEGGGEPPEQRWKLFKDYYDVIYRREKERGTSFSPILSRYEPDIHWIHHRIGWLLQRRNAEVGSTDARLSHGEFDEIVHERLQNSGHDDPLERGELVVSMRRAATDRLVLLVGNTENEIGFEIRSLQEFMAAEHVFDGGESCVQATLHSIAPDPYWRNVFLFAAGRVFFDRQELIDSVIAVCDEMNETPADVVQQTILAGSRIAVALLKDGAARNQPASIRVLSRCGSRGLDALDDAIVHDVSEVCTGEAEKVWMEELSKRLASTGTTFPLKNWYLCAMLSKADRPWARDLLIQRFPWTDSAAREFVEVSRGNWENIPHVFWERLRVEAFKHPIGFLWPLFRSADNPRQPQAREIVPIIRLMQLDGHESVPLVSRGRSTGIHLRRSGLAQLPLWAQVKLDPRTLAEAHPEWRIVHATVKFARDPSPTTLIDQLGAIEDDLIDTDDSYSLWRFPWQIRACVLARTAGHPWAEIARRIKDGALGTQADWLKWETRQAQGVELFRFCAPKDWMTVSDELQGVMLRGVGFSLSSPPAPEEVLRVVDELSERMRDEPTIRDQENLISMVCYALCEIADTLDTDGCGVLVTYVEVCSEFKVGATIRLLGAILLAPLKVATKSRLLALAGRCSMVSSWFDRISMTAGPAMNSNLAAVVAALPTASDVCDVLRAISFLPPLDAMAGITESDLGQCQRQGGRYADVAWVLRLNRLSWTQEEVGRLAEAALAPRNDYSDLLLTLFDVIELGGKSGPHLEDFVVEVLKRSRVDGSATIVARATTLLVNLVGRRPATSSLPDPAARSRSDSRA